MDEKEKKNEMKFESGENLDVKSRFTRFYTKRDEIIK